MDDGKSVACAPPLASTRHSPHLPHTHRSVWFTSPHHCRHHDIHPSILRLTVFDDASTKFSSRPGSKRPYCHTYFATTEAAQFTLTVGTPKFESFLSLARTLCSLQRCTPDSPLRPLRCRTDPDPSWPTWQRSCTPRSPLTLGTDSRAATQTSTRCEPVGSGTRTHPAVPGGRRTFSPHRCSP